MMPQDHPFEALPEARPWLDADTGRSLVLRGHVGAVTISSSLTHVPLEYVAAVTGYPLVDLSLEWDDHLVRGTQ